MGKTPLTPIPYPEIASHALSNIESLLGRWLPGGKTASGEYKVTNPLRADNKVGSFSINIRSGKWGDFATDDAGNDLISLYAYLEGIEQWEAAIDVADQIGFKLPEGCVPADKANTERQKPVIDPSDIKAPKPKEENHWHPVMPVPSNAIEVPLAHHHRGKPAARWMYKDLNGQLLGYIDRYNKSDGGKETIPWTYCQHDVSKKFDWRNMQWPEPNRPLYGLDRLAANPEAWVLLVEGEKCADAPGDMIQGVTVSWPGGSKAIEKVDWSPLAGRKIYAWSDCDAQREILTKAEKEAGVDRSTKPLLAEHDQPGMKAMLRIREKLLALDPATEFHLIDIPKPLEKPEGWDVFDAIDEGMNAAALLNFITKTRPAPEAVPDNIVDINKKSKSQKSAPATAEAGDHSEPEWKHYLLRKNGGEIIACVANIVDILENDERWKGVICYDEFGGRVIKLKKPPYWNKSGDKGEWDAQDDARTAIWVTKVYRFSPSAGMVSEAIEVMARNNVINPPKEWLEKLKWDGVKRVDNWMLDYMGVPKTQYSMRVARWFFMGMVKRVFEPGCKFDYCLVLEGPQGRKKSTALSIIGGDWYGDTDLDLHSKDSLSALRGKMLYEFSELGSVAKAEATKQKSFLSRQTDEYRPVYGRREIRAPRQLIFSGTTNEWEWNKDPTGGRRFWPVTVTKEIDAAGLKEMRDQLFAEAVVLVNDGHRYWPTTEEQAELFDPEQLSRSIHDSFIDALYEHVSKQMDEFTLFYALSEWLKIPIQNHTRDIQTRVGNAIRQLGCKRIEKRANKESRFWYAPPEGNLSNQSSNHFPGAVTDGSIPF
jgi:putative DNA primase/helicase